ncbi:MAG: M60 family metallopeptidase [Bythopirellula sp.]
MGVDFAGNVVRWWLGLDHNQPQIQDDLLEISNRIRNNSASTTGFASDEHGDIFSAATLASHNGGVWTASGVINQLDDVDFFSFNWAGGDVEIEALRPNSFTNSDRGDPSSVDLVESVYDFTGNLVAFADPNSFQNNAGMDANVVIPDLAAGTYYVSLASHGDYADVGAYDLAIQAGNWSGTIPSTNSLAVPNGLVVTQTTSTSADLSWSDTAGESGYRIERSTNRVDFSEVATVDADVTTLTDSGLDHATQYFYRVRAKDGATVSVASTIAGALTRPGAAEQLRVLSYRTDELILDWKAQLTSGETGFRIERSSDGVNFSPLATVGANTTNYFDDGLTINTTYYYRLVTLDDLGDSATSEVVARSTRLASVSNLTAVEGDGPTQVDLNWNALSGATGYLIEVGVNGVDFQTVVANHATTGYTDTIISTSNVYTYRVTGLSADSKSLDSASVDYVPPLSNLIVDSSFESADGFAVLGADSAVDLGTVTDNDGVIWSSTDGAELRRRDDIPDDGVQTLRIGNAGTESVMVQIPGSDQGVGTVQFGYSSQSTQNTGIGSLWYNDNAGSGWVEVWSNDFGSNNPMWNVKPWTTVSLGLNVAGDVDLEFRKNGNKAMFVDRVRVTAAPVVIADTSFEVSEGFPLLNNGVLSDLGTVTDNDGVIWSSSNGADLFNRDDITADGLQVIQVNGSQSLNIELSGTAHGVGTVSFGYASNSNFNTGTGSLWYNDNAGSGWVEVWSNDFNSNNPIWSNHPYSAVNVDIQVAGDVELEFRYSGNKAILVDSVVVTALAEGDPADLNKDGKVDGLDLAAWESVYGATDTAAIPGDVDADADADGADFLAWQQAIVPSDGGGFPPPRLEASYSTSDSSEVGGTFAAISGDDYPLPIQLVSALLPYTPEAGNGVSDEAIQPIVSVVDAEIARDELLAGVSQIAVVGSPGQIAVFDPPSAGAGQGAFGVIHDGDYRPMVAAAVWGSGKVVAFGHNGYTNFGSAGNQLDTGQFYLNSVEWTTGIPGTTPTIVTPSTSTRDWLVSQGFTNVSVHSNWENFLTGADLLVAELGRNVSAAKQSAVSSFVQNGGGLITGGTGWGYKQLGSDLKTLDGNEVLREAGLAWADGFRNGTTVASNRSTDLANATQALSFAQLYWARGNGTFAQREEAGESLQTVLEVLPDSHPLAIDIAAAFAGRAGSLSATPATPVSGPLNKAVLTWEANQLVGTPVSQVTAHHTAEDVYGAIPSGAPRLANHSVTINTDKTGWLDTGMYAAPGDLVTLTLPSSMVGQGYSIRLGGHVDNISSRSSWNRVPFGVSRSFTIDSTTVEVVSAFGGAIYIDVGGQAAGTAPNLGNIVLTIGGAIESPHFVLGQTTDADWIDTIRNNPGPYAEFVSEHLAFSVPSAWIRTLDNPTELMTYWDDAVTFQDFVGGFENLRTGPDRINLDVQISVGLLHAGYPIQGPTSYGANIVNLSTLAQSGDWGWFHELGHEMQRHPELGWGYNNPFTFSGDTEVTVNIFANAALELGAPNTPTAGWGWSAYPSDVMSRAITTVNNGGAPNFDNKDPYPFYFQLADGEWGWQGYRNVLSSYVRDQQTNPNALPQNNQEEKDQWLIRWSQEVGYDMTEYIVDNWALEVSASALNTVAALGLPSWMPLATTIDDFQVDSGNMHIVNTSTGGLSMNGTATFVGVTQPQLGTLTNNGNGTYTYLSNVSGGNDSFVVTYQSSAGNTQDFTIDVIIGNGFLPGDFNTDGFVTGDDLNVWNTGYGDDFDGSHFLAWQQNTGAAPAVIAASVATTSVVVESNAIASHYAEPEQQDSLPTANALADESTDEGVRDRALANLPERSGSGLSELRQIAPTIASALSGTLNPKSTAAARAATAEFGADRARANASSDRAVEQLYLTESGGREEWLQTRWSESHLETKDASDFLESDYEFSEIGQRISGAGLAVRHQLIPK